MRLIVGIDEAGYGPNLGPLVIAASVWRSTKRFDVSQGLAPFAPEFHAAPWKPGSDHVPFGDSKKIYKRSLGIAGLEIAMRFFEHAIGRSNPSLLDLNYLAPLDYLRVESKEWYAQKWTVEENKSSCNLGTDLAESAQSKLESLGLHLIGIELRILDEKYFNEGIQRLGNKAELLAETSLGLVWRQLQSYTLKDSFDSVEVYCDRQGGRKHYAALLAASYDLHHPSEPVPLFHAIDESPTLSRYRSEYCERPLTIQFQVDGDSLFPSAVASLAAKWAREVLMARLNKFWQSTVQRPIKPTAGYAVDAARFADQVMPYATQLGLDRDHWWRMK